MKRYKIYLIGMLIIPWFSLPLLGKQTFLKFFLSSLGINLLAVGESFIAHKKNSFWFYKRLHPKLLEDIPLIFGPFIVGSLWIFKFTYGHFFRYMVTNIAVDSFFVYIIMDWFKKIGYASLIRLKKYQFSFIFFVKAVVLYGLQKAIEKRLNLFN